MPKCTRRLERKSRQLLSKRNTRRSGGAINDAVNNYGRTALYIAARDNNRVRVEELIAAGADVNKARPDNGMTPLFIACENGHVNIVEKLIAAGADVNKERTDIGATPLFVACEKGHVNVVEKLIAAGADINKTNKNGATPLYIASQNGHVNVVEKLIATGADINKVKTTDGATPLFIASQNGHVNVVEKLIAAGADVNKARTDNGITPLYIAIEKGHVNVVEKLIAAGADVNKARTDVSATPLYLVSHFGHVNIVEKLIAAGADVNKARTDVGTTPLFIASENGHVNVVEKLIAAGADVNKTNRNGATPLYIASEKDHVNIVEKLIAVGADVNKTRTANGITPLYIAIEKGRVNIVEKLIAAGADVNKARTDVGITPLYNASEKDHVNIVEKLIAAGADVNKARTDVGATPLYIVSHFGHVNVVKKLIAAGADVNKARTDVGVTPLYIASENGHIEIIKILLNVPGVDKTTVIEAAKQGKFSNEITELILGKPELWQGWTRSDIDRLNEIFEDTTAPNITLCPICLKTTTRDQGCMHMKHNCKALPGFYHKRLYDLYKSDNAIHWCTICGRIGYGIGTNFEHYKLGLAKDEKPGTHGPTMVFDESCATRSGGGGLKEKLMRFQRVREIALKLNKPRYINKITEKAAKELLVEAMWDAPLITNPDINEIMETKSWNIPNTAFPVNVVKEEPVMPNVPTPPTHLDPIVHPEETEEFQNATMISDTDIIQFRHEGNIHDKEGQQISRDSFVSWIQSIGINPTEEGYLKCWAYSETGDNHCEAKLYPKEVRIALGLAEVPEEGENTEYRKLYELYRKKFNEAAQSGGRRTRRIM